MNNFKKLLETFNVKKSGTIHFGAPKTTGTNYSKTVKFDIQIDIEGEPPMYLTGEHHTDGHHEDLEMYQAKTSGIRTIVSRPFNSIILDRTTGKKRFDIITKKGSKEDVVIGMDYSDNYYPSIILKNVPNEIQSALS